MESRAMEPPAMEQQATEARSEDRARVRDFDWSHGSFHNAARGRLARAAPGSFALDAAPERAQNAETTGQRAARPGRATRFGRAERVLGRFERARARAFRRWRGPMGSAAARLLWPRNEGHKDGAVDRREAWGATEVTGPGLGPRKDWAEPGRRTGSRPQSSGGERSIPGVGTDRAGRASSRERAGAAGFRQRHATVHATALQRRPAKSNSPTGDLQPRPWALREFLAAPP
jgi:hypothetical protein